VKHNAAVARVKPKARPDSQSVQSVSRALDLLEAFPRFGPEIGLTSIAEYNNLNKATAYRLLATLEARGYIAWECARLNWGRISKASWTSAGWPCPT
jgi:hypothetical protein